MLFEVILELDAKANQSGPLKKWLDENLPETQVHDGCVSVHALEQDSDPSQIIVIGLWQSRPKWETYIKWREDRGDFEILAPMLKKKPSFECYKRFGEWKNATRASG
jgi:quinol monooxygenase YgiN